jgi:HTH-type transcriptional repressor of NAD biosynthesis genes
MIRKFKRGLVVGKFCPLHFGHEELVGAASAASESVLLLSYTKPEYAGCAPDRRERWLSLRFPTARTVVLDDVWLERACLERGLPARRLPANDDSDETHRAFVGWLCIDIFDYWPDAVFTAEDYGDGFARSLTDRFRRDRRDVPAVTHVRLKRPDRGPSGSIIRRDPHAHRHLMAPEVYATFVERVCILGAESSGKSTLAEMLAAETGSVWAPEYGRELWELRGGDLRYDDLADIARVQIEREQSLLAKSVRWLFCDTSPLTTLFYCREMFGRSEAALDAMAERAYDHTLLCLPDFGLVQDGTRRNAEFQAKQHAWYVRELERRAVPYTLVGGSPAGRIKQVVDLLSAGG